MVKTYPKLYKVASTGKIYQWEVKLVKKGNSVLIVTTDGYIDGKQKVNQREVREGKAKRSTMEQAVLQADRKFKDKTEKKGYSDNLDAVSSGEVMIVRPMLADKLDLSKLGKSIELPAFVQKKYDGVRTLAFKKDGKIITESRQGKRWPHLDLIEKSVAKIYKDHNLPDSFYLDGELYPREGSDMTFQELTGLVKRETLKPGDKKRLKEVEFYVFDCFDLNNLGLTTEERLNCLNQIFQTNYPNIRLVPTNLVENEQELRDAFQQYISEGFEGLMLRSIFGPYEVGKRSRKHLLKYKEFVEDEFEIVGYDEAKGADKGTVIWQLKTKDGKIFSARPKGSREQRREWFENADSFIGKCVTVIYQELTDDGIPRFPVAKDVREGY